MNASSPASPLPRNRWHRRRRGSARRAYRRSRRRGLRRSRRRMRCRWRPLRLSPRCSRSINSESPSARISLDPQIRRRPARNLPITSSVPCGQAGERLQGYPGRQGGGRSADRTSGRFSKCRGGKPGTRSGGPSPEGSIVATTFWLGSRGRTRDGGELCTSPLWPNRARRRAPSTLLRRPKAPRHDARGHSGTRDHPEGQPERRVATKRLRVSVAYPAGPQVVTKPLRRAALLGGTRRAGADLLAEDFVLRSSVDSTSSA